MSNFREILRGKNGHLPGINSEQVFPNNLIQQTQIDKPDGKYMINDGFNEGNVVHVKDGKLVQYDCYLPDDSNEPYVYLVWTFDYDDKFTIYREFPSLNIPKMPFCDKVIGRHDKKGHEQFTKQWNQWVGEMLNHSMQLKDNVESVSNCSICGHGIVHCKDGNKVFYCDHDDKENGKDDESHDKDHEDDKDHSLLERLKQLVSTIKSWVTFSW